MIGRVQALVGKELLDLRSNPGLFVPALLTGAMSIALPLFISVVVPQLTGEPLSSSKDFALALKLYGTDPETSGLSQEGIVQAWVFQQFLVLLLLSPIAGAMSIAVYAVIGEKQARTLEPLEESLNQNQQDELREAVHELLVARRGYLDDLLADYNALWRWSVTDLNAFWQSAWDYLDLQSPTPHSAAHSSC